MRDQGAPAPRFERLDYSYVRHGADSDLPVHVAALGDVTPVRGTYPYGYDSRCGWCWLNVTHTEAAHVQSIDERAARLQADLAGCAA